MQKSINHTASIEQSVSDKKTNSLSRQNIEVSEANESVMHPLPSQGRNTAPQC